MTTTTTKNNNNGNRRRISADVVLKDTTDLKWKLYGKNLHFEIIQESVVKIQSFVRGCLCRIRTTDIIDSKIDDIVTRRVTMARYAEEDKKNRNKLHDRTNQRHCGGDDHHDDCSDSQDGSKGSLYSSNRRTDEVFKPWREETEILEQSLVEAVLENRRSPTRKATGDENNTTSSSEPSTVQRKKFSPAIVTDPRLRLHGRLRMWEIASSTAINDPTRDRHQRQQQQEDLIPWDEAVGESCEVDTANTSCSSSQSIGTTDNAQSGHCNPPEETSLADTLAGSTIVSPQYEPLGPRDHRRSRPWTTGASTTSKKLDSDGDNEGVVTDPILKYPSYMEESVLPDPASSSRGYSRYRNGGGGKNKTRPWRDETDRFDAY